MLKRIVVVLADYGQGGVGRITQELTRSAPLGTCQDVILTGLWPIDPAPMREMVSRGVRFHLHQDPDWHQNPHERERVQLAETNAVVQELGIRISRRAIQEVIDEQCGTLFWGYQSLPAAFFELPRRSVRTIWSHNEDWWQKSMSLCLGQVCPTAIAVGEGCRSVLPAPIHARSAVIVNAPPMVHIGGGELGNRAEARLNLGIPLNAVVVGTAARIADQKRLREASEIVAAIPNAIYLVCGSGEENYQRETLEYMRQRLGDRLIHLPWQDNLADFYSAIDVFLLASLIEGCATVWLEAAWLGIPYVGYRVGAVPEWDRRCGQLVYELQTNEDRQQHVRALTAALQDGPAGEVAQRAKWFARTHCRPEQLGLRYWDTLNMFHERY